MVLMGGAGVCESSEVLAQCFGSTLTKYVSLFSVKFFLECTQST